MSNVNDANNGAQAAKENVDTPMAGETPEKLDKGKGKAAEQMPVDDSEESGEEEVSFVWRLWRKIAYAFGAQRRTLERS
ncbi:hypothetical protein D0866_06965 [Hortaea werneckii]|uniref:Uncharacterized protein n=1 Tax=Hortaea werneckii TaxID=91943 RepID=A0A3M7AX13_HORWE|nr:hypothetical protein D0866_06965 [Hortaea werneckii]